MSTNRFLFNNGALLRSYEAPPVSTFLERHPGAYTTTRTHDRVRSLMFWERHIRRLANSTRILLSSNPELIFKSNESSHIATLLSECPPSIELGIRSLITDPATNSLKIALNECDRSDGEELAVTLLVSGDSEKLNKISDNAYGVLDALNVWLHIETCTPRMFGARENAAHLALVGRGRDVAAAKYSDWVRLRKPLEQLRPPMANELLLSNDGDHILEGCITNFFVVKCKNLGEGSSDLPTHDFEVQTAPISDGLLPGVVRELVFEVCVGMGIHMCEVAPSWSEHGLWEEAFITRKTLNPEPLNADSLRILQHVESIKVPTISWDSLDSKTIEHISWKEKWFKEGPGPITQIIQKAIMEKATLEGYPLGDFVQSIC